MSNPAKLANMIQDSKMPERCELTDLLPDQCACPAHRNIQEDVRSTQKRATWRGVCRCCLVSVIEPGMAIEPYEDGWKLVDCDA